jgi:hypothetical protein
VLAPNELALNVPTLYELALDVPAQNELALEVPVCDEPALNVPAQNELALDVPVCDDPALDVPAKNELALDVPATMDVTTTDTANAAPGLTPRMDERDERHSNESQDSRDDPWDGPLQGKVLWTQGPLPSRPQRPPDTVMGLPIDSDLHRQVPGRHEADVPKSPRGSWSAANKNGTIYRRRSLGVVGEGHFAILAIVPPPR